MGPSPERRFSRFAKFGLAGVAGIGLLLPNGINMLGNILLMKTVPIGRPELQEVLQAQGYSGMLLIIFNAATLLTLTVMLARKRLRLAKAV
jgi:hypothetical protein